jgi:HAMP domain-containing protein
VSEAYYGLRDGLTYTAKGQIRNFNAKDLGREWYVRIFNGEKRIITTPYTSSIGELVMAAGVPITKDGAVAGTLCANLAMNEITSFTRQVLDFKNVLLIRRDGFIMAAPDDKDIGKSLWDVIPDLKRYQGTTGTSRLSFTHGGQTYEGSLYYIDSLNWKVLAFESTATIEKDSKENLYLTIGMAVTALLLSVLMVNMLASFLIFRPLGRGVAFAAAVSEGRLDETLDINRSDEVGVLAEALRTMVARLKEMITGTERARRHAGGRTRPQSYRTGRRSPQGSPAGHKTRYSAGHIANRGSGKTHCHQHGRTVSTGAPDQQCFRYPEGAHDRNRSRHGADERIGHGGCTQFRRGCLQCFRRPPRSRTQRRTGGQSGRSGQLSAQGNAGDDHGPDRAWGTG